VLGLLTAMLYVTSGFALQGMALLVKNSSAFAALFVNVTQRYGHLPAGAIIFVGAACEVLRQYRGHDQDIGQNWDLLKCVLLAISGLIILLI